MTKGDKPKPRYRALAGLSYPPGKSAAKGDVVDDLPAISVPWLLEQGYIEAVDDAAPEAPGGE